MVSYKVCWNFPWKASRWLAHIEVGLFTISFRQYGQWTKVLDGKIILQEGSSGAMIHPQRHRQHVASFFVHSWERLLQSLPCSFRWIHAVLWRYEFSGALELLCLRELKASAECIRTLNYSISLHQGKPCNFWFITLLVSSCKWRQNKRHNLLEPLQGIFKSGRVRTLNFIILNRVHYRPPPKMHISGVSWCTDNW